MASALYAKHYREHGAKAKEEQLSLRDYMKKHGIEWGTEPAKKRATRKKTVKQAPATETPAAHEAGQRKKPELKENRNLTSGWELAEDLGHTDLLERLEVLVAYALGRNDLSLACHMEQLRGYLKSERLAQLQQQPRSVDI